MNLNFKKNIWLAVSLSAFFISCNKKDDNIGLNLQQDEGVFSHYVLDDELDLSLYGILKNDSLLTSATENIHVGSFSDAYVGKVSSTSYIQLALAGDLPNFQAAILDSAKLRLAFNTNTIASRVLQGKLSASNTISVYLMTEPFVDSLTYYNNQTFTTEASSVGQVVYSPSQENGYIQIDLSQEFGQKLLDEANGVSRTNFKNAIYGIALVPDDSDEAIVAFDINSSNSYLRAYYQQEGVSKDYYFDLSTSNRHLVSISSDRSASTFSSLSNTSLLPSTSSADLVLFQNGVGACVVANFGDVASLIDTTQDILINKAVLRLPVLSSTYSTQENEAVSIVKIYECDEFGDILVVDGVKQILVPDFNYIIDGGSGYFGFSTTKEYYEIDLTYYFQEYILGERDLNSILISPNIISTTINYHARTNRSIIDVNNATFKIYYSDL